DPVAPGLIAHRLPAGDEVDDRQPGHAESHVALDVDPRVVGPSVLEEPEHRGQELARRRPDVTGDPAHQRVPTDAGWAAAAPPFTSRRSPRMRPVVRAGV